MLRKRGVTQAWAGSFDGLLHRDISAVNVRLAAECERYRDFFVPFGALNPQLPDWQEDLRRIRELHKMPGVRLHPNYHGYTLNDKLAVTVLEETRKLGLAVQIALSMEDDRTQHPLMRVPPVDPRPLADLLPRMRGLKLMLLNTTKTTPNLRDVYMDFAMREGPYAVAEAIDALGQDRVVLGSHAPLFYFESSALKLKESGLTDQQTKAITDRNPRSFLSA